jgi:hypothetical protein
MGRLQPLFACSRRGEALCNAPAHAAAFDPIDRHYKTCPAEPNGLCAQRSGDIEMVILEVADYFMAKPLASRPRRTELRVAPLPRGSVLPRGGRNC